jgi:hypothetical protein
MAFGHEEERTRASYDSNVMMGLRWLLSTI